MDEIATRDTAGIDVLNEMLDREVGPPRYSIERGVADRTGLPRADSWKRYAIGPDADGAVERLTNLVRHYDGDDLGDDTQLVAILVARVERLEPGEAEWYQRAGKAWRIRAVGGRS